MTSDPRYPIGPFVMRVDVSDSQRQVLLDQLARVPAALRAAVAGLDDAQLDTPYRDGGWTLRQVAHHVPDSHLNAYCRTKLALTEDHPTIRPYAEGPWAELIDSRWPLAESLALLEVLHARWLPLLRALTPDQRLRTFLHPDGNVVYTLDQQLALYAWHGHHHVAHITTLRAGRGW